MIEGGNMLRREAKIFVVGGKKEGTTLGFWEKVVTTENNAQMGEGWVFSYRRAV
jgi:hypothetical protein